MSEIEHYMQRVGELSAEVKELSQQLREVREERDELRSENTRLRKVIHDDALSRFRQHGGGVG